MTIDGAVSELDNLLKADDIPFYYKSSIQAVVDTIQPKTGHWIEDEEEMECYCSECGEENPSTLNTNYCPNCGIKMESEDKE